ncbi:MAG: SET domain-containing protein-lysine N-methyltransferase [Nannocystaceae bacterium]
MATRITGTSSRRTTGTGTGASGGMGTGASVGPVPATRSRRVVVGKAATGKGAFAGRTFKKGDVVGRVRGELTADPQRDPSYCMEMDSELFLIPRAPFRYLNHSCSPNCQLFMWDGQEPEADTGTRPLFVEALRGIKDGAELTIDYAWTACMAIRCRCGSRSCRGWVVDANELEFVAP